MTGPGKTTRFTLLSMVMTWLSFVRGGLPISLCEQPVTVTDFDLLPEWVLFAGVSEEISDIIMVSYGSFAYRGEVVIFSDSSEGSHYLFCVHQQATPHRELAYWGIWQRQGQPCTDSITVLLFRLKVLLPRICNTQWCGDKWLYNMLSWLVSFNRT